MSDFKIFKNRFRKRRKSDDRYVSLRELCIKAPIVCARDVHFVPKGSANIDEAEDERTNGAMKIVSFHDVHRDRVRCSDQLLYPSMIFLREAYWVTTSDREPSIWKERITPSTCVIDFNIVNIVDTVKIVIFIHTCK